MARKRKASPPSPKDSGSDDEAPLLDKHGKPVQRNAANARERQRMRVLSKAFGRLKTTLPWVPPDTKLSKLDTLRLASCYIGHLRQILAEDKVTSEDPSGAIHPLNLTWPFSFNSRVPGSSETKQGSPNGNGTKSETSSNNSDHMRLPTQPDIHNGTTS